MLSGVTLEPREKLQIPRLRYPSLEGPGEFIGTPIMIFQDEVHPSHAVGAGSARAIDFYIYRNSKASRPVSFAPGGTQAAEEVARYLGTLPLSGFLFWLLLLLGGAPAESRQLCKIWCGFTDLLGRSEIPGRTCGAQQPRFLLGKSAGTRIYRDGLQDWAWRRLLQYFAFFYLGRDCLHYSGGGQVPSRLSPGYVFGDSPGAGNTEQGNPGVV